MIIVKIHTITNIPTHTITNTHLHLRYLVIFSQTKTPKPPPKTPKTKTNKSTPKNNNIGLHLIKS